MGFFDKLRQSASDAKAALTTKVSQFKNGTFRDSVMGICALVASADGNVSDDEKQAIGSLITSLETLPYRTDLAVGVLTALAARQGAAVDPTTLEEPGRIPHEARRGEAVQRPGGWGATFYGSVDATPLFVMTLAEAHRRGADAGVVRSLLPAAERAVEWCLRWGDLDGDGFVEYPGVVRGASGLANQGWKDSDDAIRLPDGSLAAGPIAVVEVQGYCHAALQALADLRDAFGTGDAGELRVRAERLRAAIHDRFWLDDLDCFALALDGEKRPVRTVASNAGHLLFTGTAYPDIAARLSARLLRDDSERLACSASW